MLNAGIDTHPAQLHAEIVQLIRDEIGPVASLRRVDIIAGLRKPAQARSCANRARPSMANTAVIVPGS